jgi:hypothetical protein
MAALFAWMCEGCENASPARPPHTLGLRAKRKSLEDIEAFQMVPLVGIELTTYRLQGGCSTN